jgi:hypothetical protein
MNIPPFYVLFARHCPYSSCLCSSPISDLLPVVIIGIDEFLLLDEMPDAVVLAGVLADHAMLVDGRGSAAHVRTHHHSAGDC